MHSRLLRVAAIFIGIVGASVSTPAARAGGTGDLWVFVVGHMCLAQDVKYRTTPFGQSLMFMLSHRGDFDSRPITVCFRERRWASEALCNDLMTTIDERSTRADYQVLYNRHSREILPMGGLADYLNDSLKANPTLPCPETLGAPPR